VNKKQEMAGSYGDEADRINIIFYINEPDLSPL
jgi:hypothetical protein